MDQRSSYHVLSLALLALAFISLTAAYVAEYVFHLTPCVLCVYQRIPFAVVLVCAVLAYKETIDWQHRLLCVCVFALVVGGGIATYHVAVENGWAEGTAGCTDEPAGDFSVEAMRQQLMERPFASCTEPAFVFLGISMAGWNAVISFASALGAAIILDKGKKRGRQGTKTTYGRTSR